jgi:hypothetical protein
MSDKGGRKGFYWYVWLLEAMFLTRETGDA